MEGFIPKSVRHPDQLFASHSHHNPLPQRILFETSQHTTCRGKTLQGSEQGRPLGAEITEGPLFPTVLNKQCRNQCTTLPSVYPEEHAPCGALRPEPPSPTGSQRWLHRSPLFAALGAARAAYLLSFRYVDAQSSFIGPGDRYIRIHALLPRKPSGRAAV